MNGEELVTKMNNHLASILEHIEKSSSENNAVIREEIKNFFVTAETIDKMIAKKSVESINYVKHCELEAIENEKVKINNYLEKFEEQVSQIESTIRSSLREGSSLFSF